MEQFYGNIKKEIKSKYILKIVLSFINEIKKLNIIKYNKVLQKDFDINLETYKWKSGIIKIDGINGYGKEYKLNLVGYKYLVYEGEYLNGKRNGQGKEYYRSNIFNIIFEGEYLSGKK